MSASPLLQTYVFGSGHLLWQGWGRNWSSPTTSVSFAASQLCESPSMRRRSSNVSCRSSAATQPRPTSRMANEPASTATFIAATAE
eukprot:1682351-Pyramimonas_sp.AAC.2